MHSHPLIQRLNQFCSVPTELIPELLSSFKILELPKEKVFLREGFTNRNVYFLHTGIVRRYYISQLGHQKTIAFITENSFFTDLESFEKRKGSLSSFTTETDCIIYSIDYFRLMALMDGNKEIREGFAKMRDFFSGLAEDKKDFLASEPLENRVKMLIAELPQVIKSCRKKDIISYLRTNSQTYNFILKNLLLGHP